MNLKKIAALGLAAVFLFTGCSERREAAQQMLENQKMENRHEATSFAMDTIMTFTVIHEDGDQIIIDAEQRIRELENLLSMVATASYIKYNVGSPPKMSPNKITKISPMSCYSFT